MMSANDFMTGFLCSVGAIAVPVTFVISWGLIALYRRRVIRWMNAPYFTASPSTAETPRAAKPPDGGISMRVARLETSQPSSFYRHMRRLYWRKVAVYGLSGLLSSLLISIAYLFSIATAITPGRFLITAMDFAFPVVVVLYLVMDNTGFARTWLVGGYLFLLVLLGIYGFPSATVMERWRMVFVLWGSINGAHLIIVLLVFKRKIRPIAPLVLLIVGSIVAAGLVTFYFSNPLLLAAYRISLLAGWNPTQLSVLYWVSVIVIALALGSGALPLLMWIRDGYRRKRISEQMLSIATFWLMSTALYALSIAQNGVIWGLYVLLAGMVFFASLTVGFRWYRRADKGDFPPRHLLMLRVFSLGAKSARLYDLLDQNWRHVGVIRLIAGPDLAASTVEPHEFIDFLAGKLDDYFVSAVEDISGQLQRADADPDPDGRYRVSEFFCFSDTWKRVLLQLERSADVILMDLRRFGPQNAGCVFEIHTLVASVPLEKVVFIVDESTDEAFLQQTLGTAGTAVRLFHWSGTTATAGPELLKVLCSIAAR